MKKNRIWWIVAAAAAVVVVTMFFMRKPAKISYKTVMIERGDIVSMISATGTVNAVTSVDVGSQVSGNIQGMFVDFNSEVKKGQVIAQIDPTPFKAKLDQADATLTKAKIAVDDAKRTLNRNVELLSKNLIAQSDKDAAQTAYDNAVAQLKQSQASYNLALSDLKNTTITSPISGTVVSRNIEAGQTVAASFSAPTLFTIAKDLREMQIEANIDEGDIGRVKNGQDAVFTVDAFPDENFSGKVSQVRIAPEIVQRVVTYTVIIGVRNDELLLKPGMTANISIITDRSNNVLKIPNAALRFKPPAAAQQQTVQSQKAKNNGEPQQISHAAGRLTMLNTQSLSANRRPRSQKPNPAASYTQASEVMGTIWIMDNAKLKPVQIKTGISDGQFTEAESQDIAEGSEVVTGLNGNSKSAATQASPFGMGRRH